MYANKSYLIDVDCGLQDSVDTPPQIQNPGKYIDGSITRNDDIGHRLYYIGHKQSRFRPHVDIGHTISSTKRIM